MVALMVCFEPFTPWCYVHEAILRYGELCYWSPISTTGYDWLVTLQALLVLFAGLQTSAAQTCPVGCSGCGTNYHSQLCRCRSDQLPTATIGCAGECAKAVRNGIYCNCADSLIMVLHSFFAVSYTTTIWQSWNQLLWRTTQAYAPCEWMSWIADSC